MHAKLFSDVFCVVSLAAVSIPLMGMFALTIAIAIEVLGQ